MPQRSPGEASGRSEEQGSVRYKPSCKPAGPLHCDLCPSRHAHGQAFFAVHLVGLGRRVQLVVCDACRLELGKLFPGAKVLAVELEEQAR